MLDLDRKHIDLANEIACRVHAGQLRSDGSPYINHVERVAENAYLIADISNVFNINFREISK